MTRKRSDMGIWEHRLTRNRTDTETRGFTLLEMLVALAVAALIIGAVLGVISESLRYKVNLKEKARVQPLLESAAQIILADPVKATQGFIRLEEFDGAPVVGISLLPVKLEDSGGGLYRVMLSHGKARLEFSLIVPSPKETGGGF